MELKLKGYGTIEITNATLVDGGDILIEAADNLKRVSKTKIAKAILANEYDEWSLVIWFKHSKRKWDDELYEVIDIENQADIYKLKACL